MNSTTINSEKPFAPHILCVSQSAAMRLKLIETMDSDYVITLCPDKNLKSCVLSHSFDLGIVCTDTSEAGSDDTLRKVMGRDKVILVGHHLDQGAVARAFALGVIDYFPEPIDYNLLWQRIYYLTQQTKQ